MKPNSNIKAVFVYLLTFLILLIGSGQVLAQDLPGDHSRWIGDIEGAAVDTQGSGLVYEFRFQETGKAPEKLDVGQSAVEGTPPRFG